MEPSTAEDNELAQGMTGEATHDRCYACYRPKRDCFCATIPSIENRTNVLILQHARERFHPFNTARIARKALCNSHLLVGHTPSFATRKLPLSGRVALLYPGPAATSVNDLTAAQMPEQLVVVDGTWHHAKTMLRDIAALRDLPQYQIAPANPGRYRIRREPTAASLSTVEAIVEALRVIEPETCGLEQLIAAFEGMVDRQLSHQHDHIGWRRNQRRMGTSINVPRAIASNLDDVVVAYGESNEGVRGAKPRTRPVYWVAQRIGTGETFSATIRPKTVPSELFLEYLELSRRDFADALSPAGFRSAWSAFLRPTDTIAVYKQSTVNLLQQIGGEFARCLVLKSIYFQPSQQHGTLEEILAREGVTIGAAQHPGRAGRRLAHALALVCHVNGLAKDLKPLG